MAISISSEALVFLKTAVGGAVIGIIFDIYRIIKSSKKSVFLIASGDIIVWLVLSVVAFEVVYISNSGDIRWYEAVAMIIGFILYTLSLSKYFIIFVKLILKILKKTVHILSVPLKAAAKFLMFIFSYVKKPFLFVGFWLKLQKKRINFIKNKQIFDFRRLKRIFQKN